MRNCSLRRAAMLASLAFLALPLASFAQFQPPTSDELKMTSDPKAPGAAAVYLYREETADDNLHYQSMLARIKVLTDKGKDLATIEVPYPKGNFSVTDIRGRTIHSDGTIIPLDVKPTDLVEHKGDHFQINKMVFTLPSVEVGSILEYRWQLRYDDQVLSSPEWKVQQHYYVHKAHYSFLPFKYMERVVSSNGDSSGRLLYSYNLPPNTKVEYEASGKYTLNLSDIPAIPNEEYMPPMQTLIERVQFYYTPYTSQEEYWKSEGNRWSKGMDRFANESKDLKDAVDHLVASSDSEEVKAHKLYDAVMALDNTDYTRRKSRAELKQEGLKQIRSADDVWKQKAGSSDEIALLYLAMARIAHIKAYAVVVCDRNRVSFNPYYLSMGQFNDVLVIVSIGGKEIPVDPGEKFANYGQVGWKHTTTQGLRQSEKGPEFVKMPNNPYKEASTIRVGDVTIAKNGSVTGTARISMSGPAAMRWRQRAIENDEDELKKQFDESIRTLVPDGVDAELDHFLGLEDYNGTLLAMIKLSGNMGTATGKRVFLPGVFFESHAKHPFVAQETRITAIDMEYGDSTQDKVTYHIPDGYTVESAPPDTSIPWTGRAAFSMKSTVAQSNVEVTRTLARAFTMLPPTEYVPLRDFYQKVSTADEQQLVLVAGKPSAGTQ